MKKQAKKSLKLNKMKVHSLTKNQQLKVNGRGDTPPKDDPKINQTIHDIWY